MNWNGLFGILSNDQEHAEYEDVYNENGDAVYCDSCGEEIRWKDGAYFCMGRTRPHFLFFFRRKYKSYYEEK